MATKICACCGELFDIKSGGRKYCSAACRDKINKAKWTELEAERKRKKEKKEHKDGIEEKLKYCREHGITYSQYQKQQTVEMIRKERYEALKHE